jgi:hypothetical protein
LAGDGQGGLATGREGFAERLRRHSAVFSVLSLHYIVDSCLPNRYLGCRPKKRGFSLTLAKKSTLANDYAKIFLLALGITSHALAMALQVLAVHFILGI